MRVSIQGRTLELALGDITDQEVDAIVNAANSQLAGGGGVDGAVHRRGGRTIMADTTKRYPGGCPTGSAVISTAGDLPARFVIHAVGPRWGGGQSGEAKLLESAYRTALGLASEHGCASVALPALSCGVYGYPIDEASRIALATTQSFLEQDPNVQLARFVLFSEGMLGAFSAALEELSS
ncbi:MAG: O-acetyl-ADP-ribose deacetylase [Planctomycetota bacterium]|nr:MAG: O-acetyl-ADP-ribose deacetylase [Planctomycetota bacterium]